MEARKRILDAGKDIIEPQGAGGQSLVPINFMAELSRFWR
jgi:hypothetical protein